MGQLGKYNAQFGQWGRPREEEKSRDILAYKLQDHLEQQVNVPPLALQRRR